MELLLVLLFKVDKVFKVFRVISNTLKFKVDLYAIVTLNTLPTLNNIIRKRIILYWLEGEGIYCNSFFDDGI